MGAEKLIDSLMSNSRDQKCELPDEEIAARKRGWGVEYYEPHYDAIAFKILKMGKSKSHVCAALHCSRPTLIRWRKEYLSFDKAVITGLVEGKAKWITKIKGVAFKPAAAVNNGLIKLLVGHMYGMKDEPSTNVVIQTNVDTRPAEEKMKERGIPIPDVTNADLGGEDFFDDVSDNIVPDSEDEDLTNSE